jgi:acyl carrier protein
MEDFIKKIEEVFEMPNGSITPNDNFREYQEWDSLVLLSLMAMLDDEYNITIPRDDFQKINTVEEMFNYIKKI